MKILVCMQYWDGDKTQAERAIVQMSNLLSEPSNVVELAIVYRNDAQPPSPAVQLKVGEKFPKVHVWKCTRKGEGWPGGCNELAYGVLSWVPISKHLHNAFPDIDAILLLEADCVFTRKDWDQELVKEWGKTLQAGKFVCGNILSAQKGSHPEHVQGVMMVSSDLVNRVPGMQGGPYLEAWDAYHAPRLVPHAYHSPLFFLDYKRKEVTPDEVFAERNGVAPLIYHGVKDNSALEAVKAHYGL